LPGFIDPTVPEATGFVQPVLTKSRFYRSSTVNNDDCYYLLYAVLGEFEADLDHRQAAMNHFRKALELATMKSEQIFLSKKLQELGDPRSREKDV